MEANEAVVEEIEKVAALELACVAAMAQFVVSELLNCVVVTSLEEQIYLGSLLTSAAG